MKSILLLILGSFVFCASLAAADSIHKVAQNETVWFLAQVYYGDGHKFTEIVFANHMKKAEDLVVGEEVVVPLPKFSNKDAGFKARYEKMFAARAAIQIAGKVKKGKPKEPIANRTEVPSKEISTKSVAIKETAIKEISLKEVSSKEVSSKEEPTAKPTAKHAGKHTEKLQIPAKMPFTKSDFGAKGIRQSAEEEMKRASSVNGH